MTKNEEKELKLYKVHLNIRNTRTPQVDVEADSFIMSTRGERGYLSLYRDGVVVAMFSADQWVYWETQELAK